MVEGMKRVEGSVTVVASLRRGAMSSVELGTFPEKYLIQLYEFRAAANYHGTLALLSLSLSFAFIFRFTSFTRIFLSFLFFSLNFLHTLSLFLFSFLQIALNLVSLF